MHSRNDYPVISARHEPATMEGVVHLGRAVNFSRNASSRVGVSKSPCSRDSNTAHSVVMAKAWMKYVADDEAEKSNSGSALIAMTAEAEPTVPDV